MDEYKIIDRIPEREKKKRQGYWTGIFQSLPENKAIELEYPTLEEAQKRGRMISQLFRAQRASFQLRYRTSHNGDRSILYCWKEVRKTKP